MEKPRLTVVPKTEPTEKDKVRIRLRKAAPKHMPSCPRCASLTYITVQTGNQKQKMCAFCFSKGEMVQML